MYAWVEGIFLAKDGSVFENFGVARVLTLLVGGKMSTSTSRNAECPRFLTGGGVRPTIPDSEGHTSYY